MNRFLIFPFVYNGNDLISFFHNISTNRFVNSCTTVQITNNKLPQFLFLFCNDTDPSFDIMIKNKMIQNNTIVDKGEYQKLMKYINQEDPEAFITVYTVSDMRYLPKK